jgi:hypothetical protein
VRGLLLSDNNMRINRLVQSAARRPRPPPSPNKGGDFEVLD